MTTRTPRTPQDYSDLFGQGQQGMDANTQPTRRSRTASSDQQELQVQAEPVNTAMHLMAAGFAGRALTAELQAQHTPHDLQACKHDLHAIRAKYDGLIGRVVHDPSWFDNCRAAANTLTANKEKDNTIVIRRMAKCATCTLRQGNTCGLMGKQLVAQIEPTAQKLVQIRLASAIRNREINPSTGNSILSSHLTATQKLQQLHLQKSGQDQATTTNNRVSTRTASIIQPHSNIDQVLDVQNGRRRTAATRNGTVTSQDFGNKHPVINPIPRERTASAPTPTRELTAENWARYAVQRLVKYPSTHTYWQGAGKVWAKQVAHRIKTAAGQHTEKTKQLVTTLTRIATLQPAGDTD